MSRTSPTAASSTRSPRVLLAEDDLRLAALLEELLVEGGFEVEVVDDGRSALARALPGGDPLDVLLLDWMLPGMDGIQVCRRLRDLGSTTPVLVLTARGGVADRVRGLDSGADDYLAKPFDVDELLARVRALHRRATYDDTTAEVMQVGDLVLDPAGRTAARAGTPLDLSAREFDLLELLVRRAGRVVTRFEILETVWDGETDLRSNVIDVHLAHVRRKVDAAFGARSITTVRGVGYRLDPPDQPGPPPDHQRAAT